MTWSSLMQKKFFLYFLTLPFFIPYSMKFIPSLIKIYEITSFWKLGSVLIIFLFYSSRHRISKSMLLIFVINLIFFISSIINGLTQQSVYTDILPAFALPMLIELGIDVDIKKLLRVLCNILSLLTLINFVFVIFFPLGLPFATLYTQYRNPLHFLGQDNGIVYTLIALLGFTYFLADENYFTVKLKISNIKKYAMVPRILAFNLISMFTMFRVGSATGFMVISIFILSIGFGHISKNKNFMWILLFLYSLFFILVVVRRDIIPILSSFTNMMGRDAGFTGRSLLWERAIDIIKQHPIIGLGNDPMVINIWGNLFSSHNQLLDIAVRGGLLTLFFFIYLHIRVFCILIRSDGRKANILFVTIFCFLIGGLMESGVRPMQYVFLILASYPQLYRKETLG